MRRTLVLTLKKWSDTEMTRLIEEQMKKRQA